MKPFKAVVFPGQGSQRVGMALDFCEKYQEAQEVFDCASGAVSLDLISLLRGDSTSLNQTEITQPCILAAEIAIFSVLKKQFGLNPRFFGGHSLGEYTALVASGAIPLEIAVHLVHIRGRLMQTAVPESQGGMVALVMQNLPFDVISDHADRFEVDIANDNSPDQVVVSGEKNRLKKYCDFMEAEYAASGLRQVELSVSAPFHSRMMTETAREFGKFLDKHACEFDASRASAVLSNVSGGFHKGDLGELIDSLTTQIHAPVRWRENMRTLNSAADSILEIGPTRVLTGMFKSLGIAVQSVVDLRSMQRTFGQQTSAESAEVEVRHG